MCLRSTWFARGTSAVSAPSPRGPDTVQTLLKPTTPHPPRFTIYTLALAFTTLRNRHRANRVINVRKN
jgi:hypothetical protein